MKQPAADRGFFLWSTFEAKFSHSGYFTGCPKAVAFGPLAFGFDTTTDFGTRGLAY